MAIIVWFRQDLRRGDNPALDAASSRGPIIPVYINEAGRPDPHGRHPGRASQWWLHHSLTAFRRDLGGLVLRQGDPLAVLRALVSATGALAVFWNRRYDPVAISDDKRVKAGLGENGIEVRSFPGDVLAEPWEVATNSGSPYKVYSPFWRTLASHQITQPLDTPSIRLARLPKSDCLESWRLRPTQPDWASSWSSIWQPGESGAFARLEQFLDAGLNGYAQLRDRPDASGVSRLSPHICFGEISPRQVWSAVTFRAERDPSLSRGARKFLGELGWREFARHLLFHFPELAEMNWRREFDFYPWSEDRRSLSAWQQGMTGYPLVDAGMRELWQTGYMHNRVRMITASFLVKHLRHHWRHGASWFWDTLVDADVANNSAGWQWVAGSGADAAPYFRVFNPVAQGRKFDPLGDYVRRWCPEISRLGAQIHAPWEVGRTQLAEAGITLGETYPLPIVEHREARAAALAGYAAVRAASIG